MQKKQVKIQFLNTSGEITVVTSSPKKIFLIDSGFIISTENFKKNTTIEAVFLSHPHIDHYYGLKQLLEYFDVKKIYFLKSWLVDNDFSILINSITEEKKYEYPIGESIVLDSEIPIKATVLWPLGEFYNSQDFHINNVVLKIEIDKLRLLFTGDINLQGQLHLIELTKIIPDLLKADIIKIPGHGSGDYCLLPFLNFVKPEVAVIFTQKDTPDSPSEETVKVLEDLNVKIFRTDYNGTVTFYTDGVDYRITTEF